MKRATFIAFLSALPILIGEIHSAPVAKYNAIRSTTPIVIDGMLNEMGWVSADSAPFVKSIDWSAPVRASCVRFTWDSLNLYVAISTRDPDLWSTITTRDGQVWTEEAVEFFFDPDGDGVNYTEIDFNCRGAVVDALITKPFSQGGTSNIGWNAPNLRFALKVRGSISDQSDIDTGFTLEAAFAWKDFSGISTIALPPRAGDTLRCNTYRIEGRANPKEWSCWSSVESHADGCFHMPERFGKVVFTERTVGMSAEPSRSAPETTRRIAGVCVTRRGVIIRTQGKEYQPDGRVSLMSR